LLLRQLDGGGGGVGKARMKMKQLKYLAKTDLTPPDSCCTHCRQKSQ